MDCKRISFEIKNRMAYLGFGHNCSNSMTVLDEETMKPDDDHEPTRRQRKKRPFG